MADGRERRGGRQVRERTETRRESKGLLEHAKGLIDEGAKLKVKQEEGGGSGPSDKEMKSSGEGTPQQSRETSVSKEEEEEAREPSGKNNNPQVADEGKPSTKDTTVPIVEEAQTLAADQEEGSKQPESATTTTTKDGAPPLTTTTTTAAAMKSNMKGLNYVEGKQSKLSSAMSEIATAAEALVEKLPEEEKEDFVTALCDMMMAQIQKLSNIHEADTEETGNPPDTRNSLSDRLTELFAGRNSEDALAYFESDRMQGGGGAKPAPDSTANEAAINAATGGGRKKAGQGGSGGGGGRRRSTGIGGTEKAASPGSDEWGYENALPETSILNLPLDHPFVRPATLPSIPHKRRRGPRSSSSSFRGVTCYRRTGRYEAHIWDGGKQVHVGSFGTSDDAARAYDRAAIILRGLHAETNFPLEGYAKDEAIDYLRKCQEVAGRSFSKDEVVVCLRLFQKEHRTSIDLVPCIPNVPKKRKRLPSTKDKKSNSPKAEAEPTQRTSPNATTQATEPLNEQLGANAAIGITTAQNAAKPSTTTTAAAVAAAAAENMATQKQQQQQQQQQHQVQQQRFAMSSPLTMPFVVQQNSFGQFTYGPNSMAQTYQLGAEALQGHQAAPPPSLAPQMIPLHSVPTQVPQSYSIVQVDGGGQAYIPLGSHTQHHVNPGGTMQYVMTPQQQQGIASMAFPSSTAATSHLTHPSGTLASMHHQQPAHPHPRPIAMPTAVRGSISNVPRVQGIAGEQKGQ